MKLILNTVRRINNDQNKEFAFGDKKSLEEKLAISFINPNDFKKLKLDSNSNLKISSRYGEIIVKVEKDDTIPEGMILMPNSIWSNQLTGIENSELIFKNIIIEAESTQESTYAFDKLLQRIRGN